MESLFYFFRLLGMLNVPRWRGKYFNNKDFSKKGWLKIVEAFNHPHLMIHADWISGPRQRGT
jgi:hypothetical protein